LKEDFAILKGTTLRVYRYLYRKGTPVSMHDIQRNLNLSSVSVSQYHVRKLLEAGLVKEQDEGSVVDKIVFENMVRIRHSLIPFQTAYASFFATMLVIIVIFLRPANGVNFSLFIFAIVVCTSATGLFLYEAMISLRERI
jgi:DNA-binding transcriptional ArsR family regulator